MSQAHSWWMHFEHVELFVLQVEHIDQVEHFEHVEA